MRFTVLGPVAASDRGQEVPLGGPRQRAVLALLLLDPGHPRAADQIVTEVWGDDADGGATASLYTYVSNLRHVLGKHRVARDGAGYRLKLGPNDEVDAQRFCTELASARSLADSDPASAADRLDQALRRWHGRAYEGLEDVAALEPEINRLHELRAEATMERFGAILGAGGTPSIGEVEQLYEERPLDERPGALLMRSLYRAGRQADALRVMQRVRRRLGDELGIVPSRSLARLEEQILLHDPALDARPDRTVELPSYLTSFVGRSGEIAEIDEALRSHRLVTIIGPGGAGKTRLAVELASLLRDRFPDGVWLVDLAQVNDPGEIESAITTTLQAPDGSGDTPLAGVITALEGRTTLLVLDNAEHLSHELGDATEALLGKVDGVRMLVTSRVALGVVGEFRVPVTGLGLGDDGPPGDAEHLFVDRCHERGVRIDLASAGEAVDSICRDLDGIPLALELAASRIDTMSAAEISEMLTRRFALLVDASQRREIHRSIEATVGWSYGLLDDDDRAAFDSLGVFEGPFTAAAASAVMDAGGRTEATLARLASSSLLTTSTTGSGPAMYRLLETLRAYARDRLVEAGRWDDASERHDRYFAATAGGLSEAFFGRGRVPATGAIASELAEYVAAWDRMIAADPTSLLPLAWPLGHYWLFEGRLSEGERRLTDLVDRTEGTHSMAWADAAMIAGWLLVFRNRWARAEELTDEALAIYRALGDEKRIAFGLARAGHWAFGGGDGPAAMAMLKESLEICDRIGFEDGKAWPTVLIAQARRWSGDDDPGVREMFLDARRRFIEIGETYGQIHADMILTSFNEFPLDERLQWATEMVEISQRPGGENLMRPIALHNLAYPVWDSGDYERAEGLNRAAARSSVATGASMDLGLALLQASRFAGEQGRSERAIKLYGAGLTHFGMEMAPFQQMDIDAALGPARDEVGDADVDELTRIGGAWSMGEAAEFLLETAPRVSR